MLVGLGKGAVPPETMYLGRDLWVATSGRGCGAVLIRLVSQCSWILRLAPCD